MSKLYPQSNCQFKARVGNFIFLWSNFEDLAVFRSRLATKIFFGLLAYLKILLNFGLICM